MLKFITILIAATITVQDFQQVPYPKSAQARTGTVPATYISDLVLLYQGGTHRLPYTRDQLRPYVFHIQNGKFQWLFDGFLFIEFKDNRGHDYARGYGGNPAGSEQWEWLLDRNFEKGKALSALDGLLDSLAQKKRVPARKRKVVLTLPEPINEFKKWGMNKDFAKAEDKVEACKWYINKALSKWASAGFKHIELAGFYWVAESNAYASNVLPHVSNYIHSKQLQFYWIPYYGAVGAKDWKKMGFDIAYQQPNYFFNTKSPYRILTGGITYGLKNDMALEMEFDKRVIKDAAYRRRYDDYINEFRKAGAWDKMPVAYYEGGGAWYEMSTSKISEVKKLYAKLADIVVKRQLDIDRRVSRTVKK